MTSCTEDAENHIMGITQIERITANYFLIKLKETSTHNQLRPTRFRQEKDNLGEAGAKSHRY